jgi:hypothetical protein
MADSKISALTPASVAAAANEFAINEAGASKKLTLQQIADFLVKRAAAATVVAGDYTTRLVLAANSGDITGTGLVTVMTITATGTGRFYFRCQLVFQTTATSTGIGVAVNHTGTLTQFAVVNKWVDTLATATTGGVMNAGAVAAGNVYGSHSSITLNTLIGAVNVTVQAINSDHLMIIEGFFVCSVTGNLEIKMQAELVALVCRAMQGSYLELVKLS